GVLVIDISLPRGLSGNPYDGPKSGGGGDSYLSVSEERKRHLLAVNKNRDVISVEILEGDRENLSYPVTLIDDVRVGHLSTPLNGRGGPVRTPSHESLEVIG